jgi:regulator of replication initiation timing
MANCWLPILGKFGMDLYMNPSEISEIIGVEEGIINRTLKRRDVEIEPYLRVVSAPSDEAGSATKPQIQLRVDGLAPLIKKLTYNIPTDDIIENLSCQIIDITYLRETCDKLESENQALIAENTQLREMIESFQTERGNWSAQVEDLTSQLTRERSKSWVTRLLKRED